MLIVYMGIGRRKFACLPRHGNLVRDDEDGGQDLIYGVSHIYGLDLDPYMKGTNKMRSS